MFFISWGSKGAFAHVGSAGILHCNRCDHDAPFAKMIAYRIRHIYWIFRWITDRTPYLSCGNCGAEHLADHDAYDAQEVRAAIPFWDRRGWTVGLGAIGSVFALGSIAAAADSAADSGYVQAPHVGDVYETNIAQLLKNPEAPMMLSAMRVTGVKGEAVELQVANTYYTDWRGVDRDLDNGKAAAPDYYAQDRLVIPVANLKRMRDEGVIHDIRR
ncbi:MAG: hypothetical protein JWN66_3358 [Sphingomonas bacterium]|uniref:hypothetical protein n=1 Tax=Sphingomonas bacterium TaxID=1895847 RepID=UPI002636218C|nr:hypothetical protein [Sphingomonas bacterium]MDB5706242.1 hypothetical protein [Sphingomonas bacterium]